MQEITNKIYYVGVNDRNKALFEGLWPLPDGVSYNSYLIVDEKVCLIDTVEADFFVPFIERIREVIGDRPIDYLVVNHMEPDHSGSIALIRKYYPGIKIVGNCKTFGMMQGFYGIADGTLQVKEGDTLCLGSRELKFVMVPMVHWPETMVTLDTQSRTLFSGDAFGCFGALNGGLVDSQINCDGFWLEMVRYYSNIVGKYGTPVQNALKKLSSIKTERICSTHGPVWEKQIPEVVSMYDSLSRYEGGRGVCIVYASMYGNTAMAAKALEAELIRRGVPAAVHDLSHENLSYAYRDAFRFDTLAVGSPTYNNEIFPPVAAFMSGIKARMLKNRRFFAFGSYTWAGGSVKLLNEEALKLGFGLLSDGAAFAQGYSPEKCDMSAAAALMA